MAKLLQLRRGTTAENDLFTGAIAEVTYDADKKELRVHDGSTQGGLLVGIKAGFVCSFAGTTTPDGWLVCDGSAVSRTTYAALFAAIGTIYGSGDGSTTFNLPDVSDCFVQGGTSGTTHSAGVPNITGSFMPSVERTGGDTATGAFTKTSLSNKYVVSSGWQSAGATQFNLDASNSSSVYGASTTVQPKSVEMVMCIKY